MEKIAIAKDNEGRMKRVYLEHPVLTPEPLVQLQLDLAQRLPFKQAPLDDLHLTLFHYGKPESLYGEIAYANSGLSFEEFMDRFYDMLEHNLQLKAGNIPVTGQELDLFGDATKPVIVVKLRKQKELLELRSKVLARFNQFLTQCDIQDVTAFMQESPNLTYQLEGNYNPHFSIGFPSQARETS